MHYIRKPDLVIAFDKDGKIVFEMTMKREDNTLYSITSKRDFINGSPNDIHTIENLTEKEARDALKKAGKGSVSPLLAVTYTVSGAVAGFLILMATGIHFQHAPPPPPMMNYQDHSMAYPIPNDFGQQHPQMLHNYHGEMMAPVETTAKPKQTPNQEVAIQAKLTKLLADVKSGKKITVDMLDGIPENIAKPIRAEIIKQQAIEDNHSNVIEDNHSNETQDEQINKPTGNGVKLGGKGYDKILDSMGVSPEEKEKMIDNANTVPLGGDYKDEADFKSHFPTKNPS